MVNGESEHSGVEIRFISFTTVEFRWQYALGLNPPLNSVGFSPQFSRPLVLGCVITPLHEQVSKESLMIYLKL